MNKTLCALSLAAPLTSFAGPATPPDFEPLHVDHTGDLRVAAPPQQAFQLFTAPGERLWVKGWDPVIMTNGDGRETGSVFLTGHRDEQTVWLVVDYDPEVLRARYARITPGSRAGTVEVQARPDEHGATVVTVRYVLTALAPQGNDSLESFDEAAFSAMLTDWEREIRAADIKFPLSFD